MTSLQTCRICKQSNYESSEPQIKYGVRHYAHLTCALTKWGEAFFDRLSVFQLQQLPFVTLQRFSLLDNVRARLKKIEEKKA